MKTFAYITLLLFFCLSGRSQTLIPVDSFLGVKFGSSPQAAIDHIKSLGGIHDTKNSKKSYYVFTNMKVNGRVTDFVYFRFNNDLLFEAGAYFKAVDRVKTLPLLVNIKHEVSQMYGEGKDVREFSNGFANGDGNELAAIESGYATYGTTWVEDEFNTRYNTIELTVNSDLSIQLKFTEAKFSKARKRGSK